MRLWIWSDLHSELQTARFPDRAPEGSDIIIIAGDLTHADRIALEFSMIIKHYGLPIIFVPGNHEFYVDGFRSGLDRGIERDRWRMLSLSRELQEASVGVHVLDDRAVVIEGVRFLGATLWTDFAYDRKALEAGRPPDEIVAAKMAHARVSMQDYHAIPGLNAETVLKMHKASKAFLRRSLAQEFPGPTVVASHHVPHPAGEPDFYRNARGNCYFTNSAAAFGDMLENGIGPDLWIYGHTHHAADVRLGRTRLLCNPFGYQRRLDEQRNGFSWEKTVDV